MSRDLAGAEPALGSATPLRCLPRALRVPRRPLVAILVGWLTAFPISIALAMAAAFLVPGVEQPRFDVNGGAALFALVVFAPVVETLIMGAALLVLLVFVPPAAAVFMSAIGWGIAHSLAVPIWGLVIWWPFLIFSTLFVAWRARSLILAFVIPMCVHALQNLLPALLVAYGAAP